MGIHSHWGFSATMRMVFAVLNGSQSTCVLKLLEEWGEWAILGDVDVPGSQLSERMTMLDLLPPEVLCHFFLLSHHSFGYRIGRKLFLQHHSSGHLIIPNQNPCKKITGQ